MPETAGLPPSASPRALILYFLPRGVIYYFGANEIFFMAKNDKLSFSLCRKKKIPIVPKTLFFFAAKKYFFVAKTYFFLQKTML